MALARVISISILGLLVLQDFRKREVSVWTYYMLGAFILFDKYLCQDLAFFYTDFVINQSCVLILVISIWGYALSRCCKLEDVIGKGDLWFFEILAISFSTTIFIWFMNGSFVIALLWWFFTRSKRNIPLVGIQSICYIIIIGIKWIQFL